MDRFIPVIEMLTWSEGDEEKKPVVFIYEEKMQLSVRALSCVCLAINGNYFVKCG